MAGSGDMLNRMIRRVAELKIADRFHFTGFLQGDAVDRMFALTDVFVMPSVSEPFGLVPLEAMRINVPVIVSKQSGVAEILKHTIKVDYWDVNGTADAIWGLLHYNALAKTFIKNGKDEVDSLKWEFAAVKIVDVYKDAVKNSNYNI
jgi:glycosyltransferase involved in cell wall biosynthesis